jgi:hypothetical protein
MCFGKAHLLAISYCTKIYSLNIIQAFSSSPKLTLTISVGVRSVELAKRCRTETAGTRRGAPARGEGFGVGGSVVARDGVDWKGTSSDAGVSGLRVPFLPPEEGGDAGRR